MEGLAIFAAQFAQFFIDQRQQFRLWLASPAPRGPEDIGDIAQGTELKGPSAITESERQADGLKNATGTQRSVERCSKKTKAGTRECVCQTGREQ